MKDHQFDELLTSIQDMGKHMRGESVAAGVREFPESNVDANSEAVADIQG